MAYNAQRTLEVYGYDILTHKRNFKGSKLGKKPSQLPLIDNCPICKKERVIKWRQSKSNKPCSKCFHSLPETIEAKKNQTKIKSEEAKQKMKENHWSRHGGVSAFKSKQHTQETKNVLAEKTRKFIAELSLEEKAQRYTKASCTLRGVALEDFKGFVTPEYRKIRNKYNMRKWRKGVLTKCNHTCQKCSEQEDTLCAHHIVSFDSNEELRNDISNGICLCEECHQEFHSIYGYGDNTQEQLDKFLTATPSIV